jgi:hypothetical protein
MRCMTYEDEGRGIIDTSVLFELFEFHQYKF